MLDWVEDAIGGWIVRGVMRSDLGLVKVRAGRPERNIDRRPRPPWHMGRWQERLLTEIQKQVSHGGGQVIRRQDLIRSALPQLRKAFPDARTPEQTLSRVLQELRDAGHIEFVSPGVYRVLRLGTERHPPPNERVPASLEHGSQTEVRTREVQYRPYQDWFRSYVVPNFGHACAVCGLAPEWFVQAAHLRPVGRYPELAGDVSSGIALCYNHHRAMDFGAMTIERDRTISIHRSLLRPRSAETDRALTAYHRKRIRDPLHFPLNAGALPSIPPEPAS